MLPSVVMTGTSSMRTRARAWYVASALKCCTTEWATVQAHSVGEWGLRAVASSPRRSPGGCGTEGFARRVRQCLEVVSSYKPERVRVQVWDRLPHAESETMGVTLVKATPEVCQDPLYLRQDRPYNLLRWDLEVDPGSNGEKAQAVSYEFKLELDRQLNIGSFQSKSAR